MVLVFTIIPLVLVSSPPHNHHHQEALTASQAPEVAAQRTKHETYAKLQIECSHCLKPRSSLIVNCVQFYLNCFLITFKVIFHCSSALFGVFEMDSSFS